MDCGPGRPTQALTDVIVRIQTLACRRIFIELHAAHWRSFERALDLRRRHLGVAPDGASASPYSARDDWRSSRTATL